MLSMQDGFKFGCGFIIAQVIFVVVVGILWVMGLGAVLLAAAAAGA